jgi:hypothetical protein
MAQRKHRLIDLEYPTFGESALPPRPDMAEFQGRLGRALSVMANRNLTHLMVYGDREHFANLAYLTGFDPRFEEAVLILSPRSDPLMLVGNECEAYLPISPLFTGGKLRHERYQPLSLLDQPRQHSRLLRDILAGEGIGAGSKVGCVGWKYFTDAEHPDATHALELPSFMVDTLRELAGRPNVTNETDILMHADYGLRSFCSASEIAYFEHTNVLASESMTRMLFGLKEGMTDFQVAELARVNGTPLGCHLGVKTGKKRPPGLSGAMGNRIERGNIFAANVCYWGSNICRAGWVAASAGDLPAQASDYVANFAGPYFEAMSEWYALLKIGTPGGDLARIIADRLPFDKFGIFLNPGHLIHLDEWVSSPIFAGSTIPLHSGMAIQVDVIPSSKVYYSTRMEDGLVLADRDLRNEIRQRFPECYARCQARRSFMAETLGIELADEVLPLSNIPALVPPFLLTANRVLALET